MFDPKLAEKLKKPLRGDARIKRKRASKKAKAAQDTVMDEAKRRDHHRCRWPHETSEEREICRMLGVQAAHIGHRGMGGDRELKRTKLELVIAFGVRCHDRYDGRLGPRNRRVVFLTDKKACGPCAFEVKLGGKWVEIGREVSIGVLAR